MSRTAEIERRTGETTIRLTLGLDGQGEWRGDTGVGFLNHMLELFARHGHFALAVQATGDTQVDDHHTTEDVGICLGKAFDQALGDRAGIRRFGDVALPMEDALAQVAVDLGGRSHLAFNVTFPSEKVGAFDTALVEEFLGALAANAKMNLHVTVPYGKNAHHIAEAIFKGLARALETAASPHPRTQGVPSTKGVI